jgi:NADH dehydrogenase [ubiquinone] 1 alpha subcomplex assembly factor 7
MTANKPQDLAAIFRRLIAAHGPISVARFMGESNAHYYASRDPLGEKGDFITAPDISQMFGELIGLWLADLWVRADKPSGSAYAEFGPGRATLAKDALRAMAAHGLSPPVHLIEGSPVLRDVQRAALAQTTTQASFHDSAASLPSDGPLLIVGNEFLDALPVRQLVKTGAGWRERMVALEGEAFVFAAGPSPMDEAVPPAFREAETGTVLEAAPAAAAIIDDLAQRLAAQGGAALFIDYGHLEARTGSTLQAVRAHQKVDALAEPGEADLTAHVDFAILGDIAKEAGLRVQTTTQGQWLTAMGIDMRLKSLSAHAPKRAEELRVARNRLVEEEEMGSLFKVMALTSPDWPEPAGFAV